MAESPSQNSLAGLLNHLDGNLYSFAECNYNDQQNQEEDGHEDGCTGGGTEPVSSRQSHEVM